MMSEGSRLHIILMSEGSTFYNPYMLNPSTVPCMIISSPVWLLISWKNSYLYVYYHLYCYWNFILFPPCMIIWPCTYIRQVRVPLPPSKWWTKGFCKGYLNKLFKKKWSILLTSALAVLFLTFRNIIILSWKIYNIFFLIHQYIVCCPDHHCSTSQLYFCMFLQVHICCAVSGT